MMIHLDYRSKESLDLKRQLLEWLPALLLMGLIFALSARSDLPGPKNEAGDFALKKAAHVVAYFILALLVLFANRRRHRAIAISFAVAALYAVSDEIHQALVPGRTATLRDIGIDAFAAGAALLLARWYSSSRKKPTDG